MFVEDVAEYGEEIHVWLGNVLIFEGKYQKDNPYARRRVSGVGYEEEIRSEPIKWYRTIELDK